MPAGSHSTPSSGAARRSTSDSSQSEQRKEPAEPGAIRAPSVTSLMEAGPIKSNMVPLGKDGQQKNLSASPSLLKAPEDWVKAKEFVPGQFYVGSGKE